MEDQRRGELVSEDNAASDSTSIMKNEVEREKINARERQRMHQLNRALDELRSVLPQTPGVCKLSKMSTLQAARNHIVSMTATVAELQRLILYYQTLAATAISPATSNASLNPAFDWLKVDKLSQQSPRETQVFNGMNPLFSNVILQNPTRRIDSEALNSLLSKNSLSINDIKNPSASLIPSSRSILP